MSILLIRKAVHVIFVVVLLELAWAGINRAGLQTTLRYGVALLFIGMMFEVIRIEGRLFSVLHPFLKKYEHDSYSAVTYGLSSGLIVLAAFERNLAFAALTIFFLGDAAAALGGSLVHTNDTQNNRKTLAGLGSFVVVGYMTGIFFVPAAIGIPMTIIAAFIEFGLRTLDDNLIGPIATAFVGFLLMQVVSLV